MSDVPAFFHHGGALDVARRLFPAAPRPWLDLSTGINPRAYPVDQVPADAWTRLPDAAGLARLEQAAATRFGAPPSTCVVAAPGTQAIIQRLPELAPGDDVRILGPTYGEFERVFNESGARVRIAYDLIALAGADVAIVVNPNNPDGRLSQPRELLRLASRVGCLIVDEAFIDGLVPEHSLVPRLPATQVVVLRSLGKFYGLAGLRLGFAVAPHAFGDALRRKLGPWAVSGPAIALGTRALGDDEWLAMTCDRLSADGARLDFILRQVGARLVGGTPLFRLFDHPFARDLFDSLASSGILTRPFSSTPTRLRFGLPGLETDWVRLELALRVFR